MTDTYTVERSTTVHASPDRIYAQLVDFRRWPLWSPWEDLDPNQQVTHSGAESGTGAVYSWRGNRKAGAGRMEITEAEPGSRVEIDLRFDKPFPSQNTTAFHLVPRGDATDVRWTMTGQETRMTRVMGIFGGMDKMIGRDFEKGLRRLKRVTELTG